MKLAVIGGGYWGVNLIRVFHQLGVLGGICDFNPERVRRLSTEYPGVPADLSYEISWRTRRIDAVVIATPAETHYTLAKQACRRQGRLRRKADDVEADETAELAELAERHGES